MTALTKIKVDIQMWILRKIVIINWSILNMYFRFNIKFTDHNITMFFDKYNEYNYSTSS